MSYDTSIIIDTGGEKPAEIEFVGNYTSNIYKMYHRAIPDEYPGGGKYDGVGDGDPRNGLPGLSGLNCEFAAFILKCSIEYMQTHATEMIELEPNNGFGSYRGAIDYLRQIHDACCRHPKATLAVNW